jgi:hypothetical protein
MQVIATGTRPAGAPGPALGSRPGPMLRGPAAMPLPASQRPPGPAGAFNDRQFTGTSVLLCQILPVAGDMPCDMGSPPHRHGAEEALRRRRRTSS